MGGNFSNGNSHGGVFLGPFSSYNVSIVIFQKIIYKYNKTLKKIYTLNSWNVAQNFFPANFCSNEPEHFQLKARKAILSCEQMRVPRKMQKLKWNVHLRWLAWLI